MDNKKVENKKHMSNKKKFWLGMSALAAVGVITGTVAYFSTTNKFENNQYNTKNYTVEVRDIIDTEKSKSMMPGETVNTDVIVKNTGDIPVLTRIKYLKATEFDAQGNPTKWNEDDSVGLDLSSNSGEEGQDVYTVENSDKFLYDKGAEGTTGSQGYYYCTSILGTGAEIKHLDAFTYSGAVGNNEDTSTETTQYPSEVGENKIPSTWSGDEQYKENSKYGTQKTTTYKQFPSGLKVIVETIQATKKDGTPLTAEDVDTLDEVQAIWKTLTGEQ